jgi:hypothetical protein
VTDKKLTFWERLVDIFHRTPKVWMSKEWVAEWVRKG